MSYYDWWKSNYSQKSKEKKKKENANKEQKVEQESFFSEDDINHMRKWLKAHGYTTKE